MFCQSNLLACLSHRLYTAMSKVKANFEIVAHDGKGIRRPYGGDKFAVTVRGASFVYAKVIDNNDGTYRIEYKPSTSGSYTIAITLAGRSMPGSPFALTVLAPCADASRCILKGDALKKVVARQSSSFDLDFADAFGQIAHAEDLDVYVEPRPAPKVVDGGSALPNVLCWAVVVAPKPLYVRETSDLNSTRIGEVMPGAMVGVVESVDVGDGTRRARIIFNRGSSRAGGTANGPDTLSTTPSGTPASTPGRHTPGRSFSTGRSPRSPGRMQSPGRAQQSPGRSPRKPSPRVPRLSSPFGGSSARSSDGSVAMTDRPRASSIPRFRPGVLTARETGEAGWITAAKDGTETIVMRHSKLDASRRQEQMQRWTKQQATEANRRAAEHRAQHGTADQMRAAKAGPSCANELLADKTGIAFAYGGVDPGTIHARGKLIKSHSVFFSVGKAGQYLLHVGLRNQKAALPGSPFELTVEPGPAHHAATMLRQDSMPLQGVVGETGSLRFVTCDRMSNFCIVGQAPVNVDAKTDQLRTSYVDNEDGSYEIQWHGEVSGTYDVHVTIDGLHIYGSPTLLTLLPANPEVPKCEVSGGGLKSAIAGDPVVISVRCKDRFSNPTLPGSSLSFGLAIDTPRAAPEKMEKKDKKNDEKKREADKSGEEERGQGKKDKKGDADDEAACTLPSINFEGTWKQDGEYEIQYIAEKAGDFELHLWCDTDGDGVRQKLPGSPFLLHVAPGSGSAAGSRVLGAEQVSANPLGAGEKLELAIQLRDAYGNACAAPERTAKDVRVSIGGVAKKDGEDEASPSLGRMRRGGGRHQQSASSTNKDKGVAEQSADKHQEGITAVLITPTDHQQLTEKLRPGDLLGSFNLAHELHVAGAYEAHLNLSGQPIFGSPVCFQVQAAAPSGRLSTLLPPDVSPTLNIPYELLLIAEDKYSNKLDRGGANVQARALGPSASPATTHDYENGTYGVRFTAGAVGEYRVEVRLDNVKIKGSPHVIMFSESRGGPGHGRPQSGGATGEGEALMSANGEALSDSEVEGQEGGRSSTPNSFRERRRSVDIGSIQRLSESDTEGQESGRNPTPPSINEQRSAGGSSSNNSLFNIS